MSDQLNVHEAVYEALNNGASTEQIFTWVAEAIEEYDHDSGESYDDGAAARLRELADEFTSDD